MDYWQKQIQPLFPDLIWNTPEQKSQAGLLAVIGGNAHAFKTVADIAGHAAEQGIGKTTVYLPAALSGKVPPSPDLFFEPATESGSFARDALRDLQVAVSLANFTLLPGDLSKNSETASVVAELVTTTKQPLLITRDAFDTILPSTPNFIERPHLHLLLSMAQLQALFKSLHYPRPLLLSQPLLPVIETLHKFTTTYEHLTITTLHQNQILVTHAGQLITTPLPQTIYTPISIWSGQLATKIAAYNLWSPTQPLAATATAVVSTPTSA
jgi:hypothetical protein